VGLARHGRDARIPPRIGLVRDVGVRKRQRKYHVNRLCKASASIACDIRSTGVAVALCGNVGEVQKGSTDRRQSRGDRRKQSRSGRRASDPSVGWRWRRIAWLFAAYAAYISLRSLPETLRKYLAPGIRI
jgi:hypothetical protein